MIDGVSARPSQVWAAASMPPGASGLESVNRSVAGCACALDASDVADLFLLNPSRPIGPQEASSALAKGRGMNSRRFIVFPLPGE